MTTSVVEAAHRFLRSNTRGDLRFDEHLRPIRYVIEPGGRLVAPVMVAMLRAVETVLFVPEDVEGAMEVLLTLEPFEEQGELGHLADRWRIYHGEPEDVRWAVMSIDVVRHEGQVVDGEALLRPNPLAGDEPALCRELNAEEPEALGRLCLRFAQMDAERPVVVGVDPGGLDVRRRFDVVRVPAVRSMDNAEEAREVLRGMIEEG